MKRPWVIGLISVVGAFVVAACSGGASSTPTPTTTQTGVPTSTVESTPTPTQEPITTSRYNWEVSTVDGNGSKASLVVDPQGVPHIAYMLEEMPGFVKYAVLDDSGWSITTVSTGYFYGPLDIRVDTQGVPHISWHNHDTENEAYAALIDGKWVVEDIGHPGHDGWDNSLAVDSNGRPHTISIDPSQFGSRSGIEYATFDGQSWKVEEVGSGPVPYEFGTGIALDSQDRPHVVWFDDDGKDLRYAIKDEGAWVISTVDSEGDVGRFASLALGKQGNPTISYFERVNASSGYIKFARGDGSKWSIQRIDKLENVFLDFFGARKISSLVLDQNDNPIVAYSDEQIIKLAWWDGSQWNLETVLTAEDNPLGQQVSLALDSTGVLHLTFADVTRKGSPGVTGAVKYARGTPAATAAPAPTPAHSPTETSALDGAVEPDPNYRTALSKSTFSTRGWETDFSRHTVPYSEIVDRQR